MRENIIKEKHNGSLEDHFGLDKTLEQVRRFYYWPKLQVDVRRYVEGCTIFQREKGTSSNARLYQPLPIPNRPWECVSMDLSWGFLEPKEVLIVSLW